MAYHSKYSGAEVDALLDKIKDDNVGSIDSSLSTTSENPVKNKVITEELNKKANKTDIATINGQTLTDGGNIEVVTDAYDDTEIKGKLTELDSQIDGEATARTNADAELQTQINSKQEALTLTVKDNGNIVLANIQGQSKEFMPATPSGDPMHYAYVAAGAEYNDTGADIVKTTPWADMIDDDYDGLYGKTVVHKSGFWYLNGLGDITNEEIRKIYTASASFPEGPFCAERLTHKIRTNYCNDIQGYTYSSLPALCIYNLSLVICKCNINLIEQMNYAFLGCSNLAHIIGKLDVRPSTMFISVFRDANSLIAVKLYKIEANIDILSPKLSIKSVLYMINNEAATSPITITLHADVYNRCMANADILAALETHTNISLASA